MTALAESHVRHAVCVFVCVYTVTAKSIPGGGGTKSKWEKSSKFVEFCHKRLPECGESQVNFMDCWCGTTNADGIIKEKKD